jgi:hypothetical protein
MADAINLGATPLDALYVGDVKVWPADTGLPGLAGWADITTVTGSPKKYEYTDAQGFDWTAYEWVADGNLTVTEGLVDALIVGGGVSNPGEWAEGGDVFEGIMLLSAGVTNVLVGGGARPIGSQFGKVIARSGTQTVMPLVLPMGAGARAYSGFPGAYTPGVVDPALANGVHSPITGVDVEYGKSHVGTPGVNPGDGGSVGKPGVVIVRVPRANAKA